MSDIIISKFKKLFSGFENAFTTVNNYKEKDNGKVEAQVTSRKGQISDFDIKEHLYGNKQSVGVIPLREDNTVYFGVIDLDIVGSVSLKHSIEDIEKKVKENDLPLLPCWSKSKGIHLYLFLKEPVEADFVVKKLKNWATSLGYSGAEVFPKQVKRASERDIGNAINLPYFNSEKTTRYCVKDGKPLTLEEFLELAELMKVKKKNLKDINIEQTIEEEYREAPPCIQHILKEGIEEGSRNNGLYCLGVFFKQKYPDVWQDKLDEANKNLIRPSLKRSEVEAMIKGLIKPEAFYRCNEYPICQFCDKEACRKRMFGIGGGQDNRHLFSSLIKYQSKSGEGVRWSISFDGERIELTTDELMSKELLQKKIFEKTNKMYYPPKKNEDWMKTLEILAGEKNIVDDPEDASEKGQFEELLKIFLAGKKHSNDRKILTTGGLYFNEQENLIYFRSIDLNNFLKSKRFNKVSIQQIWSWFTDLKGGSKQMSVGGHKERLWFIEPIQEEDVAENDELI